MIKYDTVLESIVIRILFLLLLRYVPSGKKANKIGKKLYKAGVNDVN